MSLNPWQKIRKICRLPGARCTPETALAQVLEMSRAGEIDSVMIGIKWKDGTMGINWSAMEIRDQSMMALLILKTAADTLKEGGESL